MYQLRARQPKLIARLVAVAVKTKTTILMHQVANDRILASTIMYILALHLRWM